MIIAHLRSQSSAIDKAQEERLEAMREAETRNQSRYDTKGWEAAREAEGIEQLRSTLQLQQKFFLECLRRERSQMDGVQRDKIVSGTLIQLTHEDRGSKWIFLVGCPGGIDVDGVIIVSVAAPVGRLIINKAIGSTVQLPEGKYRVAQIL